MARNLLSSILHGLGRSCRALLVLCAGGLLAVSSGCVDLLPAGEPPEGDIVKNEPVSPANETPRARENRLATALIACALRSPERLWSLQCDPDCLALGERLMQAVSETAGVRRVPAGTPGSCTLRGEMQSEGEVWSLLSPAGAVLWQDR